jgi:hypothetical protein
MLEIMGERWRTIVTGSGTNFFAELLALGALRFVLLLVLGAAPCDARAVRARRGEAS